MFIAMNRFRIVEGHEDAFEKVWRERDSHLKGVPGFRTFHLVKGPTEDGITLFATHVEWDSREAFEAWTESEAFERAHRQARSGGSRKEMYAGPPKFEGFEVLLEEKA